MDERLKALRFLHQAMMLASAAVLAFALSPDFSSEYRAALQELTALREISLDHYPSFVKDQFRKQQDADYRYLLRVVRGAGLPVKGQPHFTEAFLCDPPPAYRSLRLVDHENFLAGNRRAAPIVIDRDTKLITERLRSATANLKPLPSLVGIDVAYPNGALTIWPDNARIWDWTELANSASNVTNIRFYFSDLSGQPPNIPPIPVTYTVSPNPPRPLALEWLRSDPLGRQLVDEKSGIVFPHLKSFWERVATMEIDGATIFLQEQTEATKRGGLSFFGIPVERKLVIWVGPAICVSVLVFFVLHFRHLLLAIRANSGLTEIAKYPWVICFPDRISGIVGYGTLFLMPLVSTVLLLVQHGNGRELTTSVGIGLTLAIAIIGVIFAAQAYRFRRAVRKLETANGDSENAPHSTSALKG